MFNDDTHPSETCSHAFQDVQGHVWAVHAGKGESLTRSPDPVSLLGHTGAFSQGPPVVSAQSQWSTQRSGLKETQFPQASSGRQDSGRGTGGVNPLQTHRQTYSELNCR